MEVFVDKIRKEIADLTEELILRQSSRERLDREILWINEKIGKLKSQLSVKEKVPVTEHSS